MDSKKIEIEVLDDIDLTSDQTDLRTSLWMTKYEYTAIIGKRALQLSAGDPPRIKTEGMVDPIEIAKEELLQRKTPLSVKRRLPSGEVEVIKIKNMNIRNY